MDKRIVFFAGLVSAFGLAAAGCGDDPKPSALDAGSTADAALDSGESDPPSPHDAAVAMAPSSVGSCCEAQSTAGCGDPAVEACVCALDRLCCAGAWDARCVELVDLEGCGQCGAAPSSTCEVVEASDAAPSTMLASIGGDGANDAVELSCGSIAEPEALFAFTAPEAGSYTFSTDGSEVYDTVLAVLDGGACNAEELGCNDDDEPELSSRLVIDLEAGQEVLIAVESWGEETGDIQVEVAADDGSDVVEGGSCSPSDLSQDLPASAEGEANLENDLLTPSCAFFGSAGEALYRFTAPEDARYRFDTRGSVADTLLQVLDGGDCEGEELACNDDPELGGLSAIVDVDLSAGQTVLVNVDSVDGAGSYVLTIDLVDPLEEIPDATDLGCCAAHDDVGCDDVTVQNCVCRIDAGCCSEAWAEQCAGIAILDCGGC